MSLNQLQQSVQEDLILSAENNVKRIKININLIYRIIKRTIDILGSIVGIILLVPITIGVFFARIITKENKGAIFYDQLRIGKDGKTFKLYKYRSMVLRADEALKKYLEENEEARKEYKIYKKLKNDPRITKVGNFLRKTSLDEFPQFINVLKGEMSLVGPRPYLPREKEDMEGYYETIISVKPGLTGYWQIRGRNDVTFEDRMKMDLEYCGKISIIEDIKIIFKTLIKVVRKEGAK